MSQYVPSSIKARLREVYRSGLLDPPEVRIHQGIKVVRDDLLEGGTKVRIFIPYMLECDNDTFVYASPTWGYAQVALAAACNMLERKAVVFVPKRAQLSEYTIKAQHLGAEVHQVKAGYQNVLTKRAQEYCQLNKQAMLMPFGGRVDYSDYYIAYAAKMIAPPEVVWCAMGSGTLISGLHSAWAPHAKFCGVRVGAKVGLFFEHEQYQAPEAYEQDCIKADRPLDFPSNLHYDAKVWRFIQKYSVSKDALFWNVAA
jgi:pyridoxal-phosphate dependent enzyme